MSKVADKKHSKILHNNPTSPLAYPRGDSKIAKGVVHCSPLLIFFPTNSYMFPTVNVSVSYIDRLGFAFCCANAILILACSRY